MNLPDTYAGGQFGLPLKVAKLVRLASDSEPERANVNRKLESYGYFVDRVGIVWDIDKVPEIAKDNWKEIKHGIQSNNS